MLDLIKGFHLETTNICTLQCPGCARTRFIKNFPTQWNNKQLNLTNLKNFLDIDIKSKIFNLCGNYGDTIYYNDLFDLVKWIKQNNGIVAIGTNGSYKSKKWWNELCSLLSFDDHIIFAIDGTPENFTNYRINADWPSIKDGIEVSTKFTKVSWKFIPFEYNQFDIDKAKAISKDLGVHSFIVDPSDRWNEHTVNFKPDTLLGYRTEHVINWLPEKKTSITPKCKTTHFEHFISAEGYYMPCCFVADYRFYYASEFYKNKKSYDISNTTLTSVLENLESFYQAIEETKLKYCTFNCPKI